MKQPFIGSNADRFHSQHWTGNLPAASRANEEQFWNREGVSLNGGMVDHPQTSSNYPYK